jgi:hypothetical protein
MNLDLVGHERLACKLNGLLQQGRGEIRDCVWLGHRVSAFLIPVRRNNGNVPTLAIMRRYIFDAPDIPLKFAMGRQIHRHIQRCVTRS